MAKAKRAGRTSKQAVSKQAVSSTLEYLETRVLFAVHNDSFDVTGLTQLRSSAIYSSITGSGVAIAVLDTGVDVANPDLTSKVKAYYNAVENGVPTSISSTSASSAVDNDGHGTHTSGTAASADPAIGVAYGANLVDVKVIADSNERQLSGDPLLRGLQFVQNFASQFNIKVVSMSLGESTSSGGINDNTVPAADDISKEISVLEGMGITVVAASGNSYANDPTPGEGYPAVVSTIGVASTWANSGSSSDFQGYAYGTANDSWAAEETSATADQFSATSQRSTLSNQVVAPGVDIYSDWNGSSTDNSGNDLLHNTLTGTSMATPFVAGMVALMQQAALKYGGRYITDPNQVLTIIRETSDKIADPNIAGDTRVPIRNGALTGGAAQPLAGTGATYDRVNLFKAIQAVQALFTGTVSNADIDNTTATATTVQTLDGTAVITETGSVGTDGLNNVGANDIDLYKVNLSSPGSLTAALTQTGGGTPFTGEIRLFDSTGAQIDVAVGTSSSGYPSITTATGSPLTAGIYYIGISSAGNGAYSIADGSAATGGSTTGDYTLTLSLSNPDPNGVIAGAVVVNLSAPNLVATNGTSESYYPGTLGSDPAPTGSTDRVVVTNGDVDMFNITAPDTGVVTAQVNATNYNNNGADSFVEVFRQSSDGTVTVVASNGVSSGLASNSQVQFNVVQGQTYFVAVTVYTNNAFSATNPYDRVTGSTAAQKSYDLYLSFDNGNSDGTLLLAKTATVATSQSGTIASTDVSMGANGGYKYVDWYAFTVPSTGLLDLTATATSSGFTPSIELWSKTVTQSGSAVSISGTQIGAVSGSGQSLIDQLTAGTVVYAAVTSSGNSNYSWDAVGSGSGGSTGTYTLTSSILPASSYQTLNNDSVDYGTPTAITTGNPLSGTINTDGGLLIGSTDVDLYKFVPTTTGSFDIRTDTSQEGSADTVLRLFDGSGNQISLNDNASSATTGSFIRAALTAGQTYYIGVSGTGNSTYNPITDGNTAAGSTGNYVLSVTTATIPVITVASPPAVAPVGAGAAVTFTVSLDQASTSSVTVDYATADGSAVAGTDYTATSGTLTFSPGQTTATVSVPLLIDPSATGTNTFNLDLSNPSSNAELDGGQAVGTITSLPVTTSIVNTKTRATYIDSSGRKVTVTLGGAGSGIVTVVGSTSSGGPASSVTITLTDTTAKSHLSISTSRAATTPIDGLQINGSLGLLSAAQVELAGNLTVTGTIGNLILAGASGDFTLSVQGTGAVGSLNLGNVTDLTVTSAEPLKSVAATNWTNLHNVDVLTAPSILSISSKGDFGASVAVSGAIGAVRIGKTITGGNWSAGSISSLVARATASSWKADVTGALKSMLVTTNAAGKLTAGSIGTLQVRGNLSAGSVTTTNAGATPSIRTFAVGGTITDSTIRSAGTITTVHVGAITGSSIFAGTSANTTALPGDTSVFTSLAAIQNFAITGVRGAVVLFSDSIIAAASLGKVSVSKVDTDNQGTPFGFAAESIVSFADTEPKEKPFRWNDKLPVSDLTFTGDFTVRVV